MPQVAWEGGMCCGAKSSDVFVATATAEHARRPMSTAALPEIAERRKETAMSPVKEAPSPVTTNGPEQKKEVATRTPAPMLERYAHPFTWMREFAEDMDRMFEDFGFEPRIRLPRLFTRGRKLFRRERELVPTEWAPRVEVLERQGELVVRAELPGVPPEAMKVEIHDNLLTLEGERKLEKKEEREGYCYSEWSYGTFYRSIPLPEGVDTAKAKAEFKNGVLEVTMPGALRPEQKPRRLEVREAK